MVKMKLRKQIWEQKVHTFFTLLEIIFFAVSEFLHFVFRSHCLKVCYKPTYTKSFYVLQ